jgi:predicted TIM-barrel fold metal-dependent hydrolase
MQDDLKIISVDDHILEPRNLWQDRMPAKYKDRAPRVERKYGYISMEPRKAGFVEGEGPGARPCDVWLYDDLVHPQTAGYAALRLTTPDLSPIAPINMDEMLPGCYEQASRIKDMASNNVSTSLCFPTFPRFCGQTFAEREDKELALLCLQTYNDWMIDEWCAGDGYGHFIPLTLIPLWDPELAAVEVRRCAGKGSGAIAFSEQPAALGLPSIYSGHWDPLFQACEETGTVINMHIGSASKLPSTSPDAPVSLWLTLTAQNAMGAFADWLLSGVLERYKTLKIALSEGQIGWVPYILERIESIWERADLIEPDLRLRVPNPPHTYLPNRVYGCVVDDVHGMKNRDILGMSQIMFEVDYPHADSTFPASLPTAEKLIQAAGLTDHEAWQLVRGNAIECYNLQRFGIDK